MAVFGCWAPCCAARQRAVTVLMTGYKSVLTIHDKLRGDGRWVTSTRLSSAGRLLTKNQ